MKPFVYTNRRGETVMEYGFFTQLSDRAKNRITRMPYPRKNRSIEKRRKHADRVSEHS